MKHLARKDEDARIKSSFLFPSTSPSPNARIRATDIRKRARPDFQTLHCEKEPISDIALRKRAHFFLFPFHPNFQTLHSLLFSSLFFHPPFSYHESALERHFTKDEICKIPYALRTYRNVPSFFFAPTFNIGVETFRRMMIGLPF